MINYKWHSLQQSDRCFIPADTLNWLEKPFILSKALKKVYTEFSVSLVSQSINYIPDDEVDPLECQKNTQGLIREVYLLGNCSPCIYARVTVPEKTFLANREDFENLGNRPIGETMLYNDPSVTRGDFEIKRLTQDDYLLFDSVVHQNFFEVAIASMHKVKELWARRSVFTKGTNRLLVTEVFLANIPNYQE